MDAGAVKKKRPNWWMWAFFAMLLAFEFTREIAVLESYREPLPNASASVTVVGGWVNVRGMWQRTDGGGRLAPGLVTIECSREDGECIEANTNIIENSVFPPEIDRFPAQFSGDTVLYENNMPVCAKYTVRIDLRMHRAFAVRERKDNERNPMCRNLERRIEMQIGSAQFPNRTEGHFVPILRLLGAVF